MNKMIPLLTLTASLFSTSTFAQSCDCQQQVESSFPSLSEILSNPLENGELEIKFGGWSHHYDTYKNDDYDFNESHNGFGLEYLIKKDELSPHNFGVGFWTMKDSYNTTSYNVGVLYKYDTMFGNKFFDMFDFNLALYYVKRSERYFYESTLETVSIETFTDFMIHPYITFQPTKLLSVDLMYVPNSGRNYAPQTLFLRGSVNTNELIKLFN